MEIKKPIAPPSISQSTAITCESCGSTTFKEVVFIRKMSRILTGEPQDSIIPIPTFECSKCQHINKDFTPNF